MTLCGRPNELSIARVGEDLRSGKITSRQLTEHTLELVAKVDPLIHAFVCVTEEQALADAAAADARFSKGIDNGPLQGVPYALKDVIDVAGISTTCHSKLRAAYVSIADSHVAARLRSQGAVLIGKLSTYEFALGGPSFDLPFPPARNPWNLDHMPGGTSSGSAAAVSAGLIRLAVGTDTGGSIRGPAAYCGVVGFKPTYGLVSCRGVFPLSPTLDHCGPLAKTVEDAAIALEALAGFDRLDPASVEIKPLDYRKGLNAGVDGLRIAVPRHLFEGAVGASSEVLTAIDNALATLAGMGAEIEEVRLPDYDLFNACGRTIMLAEAYAIHERDLRDRPLDYGMKTYLWMALGGLLTAADLAHALRLRRELSIAVNSTLRGFDALITASALTVAPRFDAVSPTVATAGPLQTIPFNVTGNPAMSIPIEFSADGLPISLQIVGRPFDEAMVVRIGAAFERATAHHRRFPELRPDRVSA